MDGAGANMCKAVNIEGVAVKATFVSRVCVGGKSYEFFIFLKSIFYEKIMSTIWMSFK